MAIDRYEMSEDKKRCLKTLQRWTKSKNLGLESAWSRLEGEDCHTVVNLDCYIMHVSSVSLYNWWRCVSHGTDAAVCIVDIQWHNMGTDQLYRRWSSSLWTFSLLCARWCDAMACRQKRLWKGFCSLMLNLDITTTFATTFTFCLTIHFSRVTPCRLGLQNVYFWELLVPGIPFRSPSQHLWSTEGLTETLLD